MRAEIFNGEILEALQEDVSDSDEIRVGGIQANYRSNVKKQLSGSKKRFETN